MEIGEPTVTNRKADGDLIGNRLFPVRSPMGTKWVTDGDQKNGFAATQYRIRIDARPVNLSRGGARAIEQGFVGRKRRRASTRKFDATAKNIPDRQ